MDTTEDEVFHNDVLTIPSNEQHCEENFIPDTENMEPSSQPLTEQNDAAPNPGAPCEIDIDADDNAHEDEEAEEDRRKRENLIKRK